MKVLLVGAGAREHALAQSLRRNPLVELHAAMPHANPGIKAYAKSSIIASADDIGAISLYAKSIRPVLAVFGPETPLVAGAVDVLEEQGIPCFGPRKALARLEGSKSFCRGLLAKHGITGNPRFRSFATPDGLEDYLELLGPCVVKADGLAGGKGVRVWGDHLHSTADALKFARSVIAGGSAVVVEEKLEGEEFSLMSISDGKTLVDCPAVQDHKRAFEGDAGPNTGGMGAYSMPDHSLPFLNSHDLKAAHAITEKVMKALEKETGSPYKGVLYGGFMATAQGVRLLEYNCRFGDPEAMNALGVMETDFAYLALAVAQQRLAEFDVKFAPLATVCRYLVPNGYPDAAQKGGEITINPTALSSSGASLYYASVEERSGKLLALGSRAIAVLGKGESLEEARKKAAAGINAVKGQLFSRQDIGTQALVQKRVSHMAQLRKK
jgi:phosphoribosylamine--glycine ligase